MGNNIYVPIETHTCFQGPFYAANYFILPLVSGKTVKSVSSQAGTEGQWAFWVFLDQAWQMDSSLCQCPWYILPRTLGKEESLGKHTGFHNQWGVQYEPPISCSSPPFSAAIFITAWQCKFLSIVLEQSILHLPSLPEFPRAVIILTLAGCTFLYWTCKFSFLYSFSVWGKLRLF